MRIRSNLAGQPNPRGRRAVGRRHGGGDAHGDGAQPAARESQGCRTAAAAAAALAAAAAAAHFARHARCHAAPPDTTTECASHRRPSASAAAAATTSERAPSGRRSANGDGSQICASTADRRACSRTTAPVEEVASGRRRSPAVGR